MRNLEIATNDPSTRAEDLLSLARHLEEPHALQFLVQDLEIVSWQTDGLELLIQTELLEDWEDVGTERDDGAYNNKELRQGTTVNNQVCILF